MYDENVHVYWTTMKQNLCGIREMQCYNNVAYYSIMCTGKCYFIVITLM